MPVEMQLKAYADAVNARLGELLPPASKTPRELHEAMRYSCLAPGKRMRPALCMAAAEAVGGRSEDVIDAACAVEMVHCFSLIHDDLPAIDDDDLRRGMPTCHKKFGEAIAILAGDALFALAFEVLAHVHHTSPEAVLTAVQVLTHATGSEGLVGGEVVDVLSEGRQITDEQLAYIHKHKTGSLIAAACEIGAIMGGGGREEAAALRHYGQELGLAFQIADDILNEVADPVLLGKAVGSDREKAKATYTSRYGIHRARELALAASQEARRGLPTKSEFLEELALFAIERLT